MPGTPEDRRGELLAADLAGELSPAEQNELERLKQDDPSVEAELDEMRSLTAALSGLGERGRWIEQDPPARLREGVTSLAGDTGASRGPGSPGDDRTGHSTVRNRFRRRTSLVLGAAACIALGAGLAAGAYGIATAPPTGPPGTLGAVEEVAFSTAPSGVQVEGALVAHTWGTETVMQIDGLNPGEEYLLVLMTADGTEFASGALLGSEITIECRMNAAGLREDVTRVEIRDVSGAAVTSAEVPEAVGA